MRHTARSFPSLPISDYNRHVLDSIERMPDVRPGEFRHHSVMVGNHRGA